MKRESDWPVPPPNAGVVVRDAPGYPDHVRLMAEAVCGENAAPDSLIAMAAVLSELLGETFNEDALFLSLEKASDVARVSGVEQAVWKRVRAAVERHWEKKRALNPLRGIF